MGVGVGYEELELGRKRWLRREAQLGLEVSPAPSHSL